MPALTGHPSLQATSEFLKSLGHISKADVVSGAQLWGSVDHTGGQAELLHMPKKAGLGQELELLSNPREPGQSEPTVLCS